MTSGVELERVVLNALTNMGLYRRIIAPPAIYLPAPSEKPILLCSDRIQIRSSDLNSWSVFDKGMLRSRQNESGYLSETNSITVALAPARDR